MDEWTVLKMWCSDGWHLITDHPVYAFSSFVIISALTLHLYCRMTVGKCTCQTSMVGKTVVITGGNSGIGFATAQELAKRGGKIILACRSKKRGQKAVDKIIATTENPEVFFMELDLCSLDSVRKFVQTFSETEGKLDVLINNAGITGTDHRQTTVDGCERILQTNYLGHFLLTNLLLDKLKTNAPCRIIFVSSNMYTQAKLDFQDFQNEIYDSWKAYSKSKLAVVIFARELSRKLEGTGTTVNCVHPGVVRTTILKEASGLRLFITKLMFWLIGKTPEEGANAVFHLALSPDLEDVSGKYFADCVQRKMPKYVLDEDLGQKLWTMTEQVIKLAESKTSIPQVILPENEESDAAEAERNEPLDLPKALEIRSQTSHAELQAPTIESKVPDELKSAKENVVEDKTEMTKQLSLMQSPSEVIRCVQTPQPNK